MSSINRGKLYKDLFCAYSKAYSETKSKQSIQDNVNNIWSNIKNDSNVASLIEARISELNKIKARKQVSLHTLWLRASEKGNGFSVKAPEESTNRSSPVVENEEIVHPTTSQKTAASNVIEEEGAPSNKETQIDVTDQVQSVKANPTPAQCSIKSEIVVLLSDVKALKMRRDCGLLTENMESELKLKTKNLEALRKRLKKKERDMIRHRKRRLRKKASLENACENNPDLKKKLSIRGKVGRPRIEEDQPYLLKAIIDLAMHGSAAHERRRDDSIRTVKTLDDLVTKLREDYGYNLSRSATYLRLLPKRANSTEGKRHVNSVPVKLIRPDNDLHKDHMDGRFAKTTISHIDSMASLLGPNEVTYISQDDKAKVAIGLPAASKQAPLLMHMEYRVKLPDHDFVIAKGHKLTPSVYGFCQIKANGGGDASAISYSGPTFVAIRSSKHSSSTAFSHARDLEQIYEKSEFSEFTHTTIGGKLKPKPVLVCIVDGGPDENPRYEKVISMAVHHFVQLDLDAIMIACNAPGRSAFNRTFKQSIDSQGQTVDIELEKQNFSYTGKALAEVWSDTLIDGHLTVADYIKPEQSDIDQASIISKDEKWCSRHVHQSQYLLQILKCSDNRCCKPRRSSLFRFLPKDGLPPPSPIIQSNEGLKHANINDIENYASLFVTLALQKIGHSHAIYDTYCPSVQSKLDSRTCSCNQYFSSVVSMKRHLKDNFICKKNIKIVKPVKILGTRGNESLVVVRYNVEEDVEWLPSVEVDGEFLDKDEQPSSSIIYDNETRLKPIWRTV
ncbi:uncharacterized protein LOC119069393 [Bradysia coprophila]|uniref:uncharacterized protein LOC119069393 n=1 Tax=Bradysia coprophila TaxID=38358 RepID=UPI00187D8E9B|nr:uncharacterized protein LOC119069393 [Bradysia coprophila]